MHRQLHQTLYIATLVAGVSLALLAPVFMVPDTIRNKGLYIAVFNPFQSNEIADIEKLNAAGARLVTRGYPGIYLVSANSPSLLRHHGTLLVLPPTLGLGCDFSAIDQIEE